MKNKDTKVEIAITVNGKQHFVSAQDARQIFFDLQSVFQPVAIYPTVTTTDRNTYDPTRYFHHDSSKSQPQVTFTTTASN